MILFLTPLKAQQNTKKVLVPPDATSCVHSASSPAAQQNVLWQWQSVPKCTSRQDSRVKRQACHENCEDSHGQGHKRSDTKRC